MRFAVLRCLAQPAVWSISRLIVMVDHVLLLYGALANAQLEIAPDLPSKLTLTYALGVEHGLYAALAAAPENQAESFDAEPTELATETAAAGAEAPGNSGSPAGGAGTALAAEAGGAGEEVQDDAEAAEERESKRRRV